MSDQALPHPGVTLAAVDALASPAPEIAYPFTSYRLSHATPSHLHTISRVVLIGPIPADWLRRHQNSWLARVSRSTDAQFKQAWSSVFPDLPPPHPALSRATSVKIPASVRHERIKSGSASMSAPFSSSFRSSAAPRNATRTTGISYPEEGSPSRMHNGHASPAGGGSPAESQFATPVGSYKDNYFSDGINAALSSSIESGPVMSSASSYYHDVRSRVSSAESTPMHSPALTASEPLLPASPTLTPFARYSDVPASVEISRSLSRGRSVQRFGANSGSLGEFAPSSYTSTQSFLTARGTSISASTTTDRSARSASATPSQSSADSAILTPRRRSNSQGSEASTIRPERETVAISNATTSRIASAVMPVSNSTRVVAVEEMQPPQPVILHATKNAAKSSLSVILQKDEQVRQIRSQSRATRGSRASISSFASDRPLLAEADRDDRAHSSHNGSDDDSIRDLDFNFMPRHGAMAHHHGEDFDVVIDGQSVLGALGPDLANGCGQTADAERYKLKRGQIVKVDRVLVSIKSANVRSLPSDFNEADTTPLDVVERAREYVAVTRYFGNEEVPFCLELYKSLIVPAISTESPPSSIACSIPLDRKFVGVNLFSSLDKSLALWTPDMKGRKKNNRTMIYILRFRSPSTSIAWYGFLRGVLGGKIAKDIILQVPDLEASLKIGIPWDDIREHNMRILLEAQENEDAGANHVQDVTSPRRTVLDITEYTIQTALDILEKVPEYAETVRYWRERERLGLAWRRYDRIEWLHDVTEQHIYAAWALRKTHELELRPQVHYPTFSPLPKPRAAQSVAEPPPIEGFLIRLTQHSGNTTRLGRLFYKQFYFMCHDNMLLFGKPHHATPPAFEKPFSLTEGSGTRTFIHEFTPYPMKEGKIEWLDGTRVRDTHKLKELDDIALSEVYRRLYQILTSSGFIDLCDVVEVRKVERNANIDSNIGVGDGVNFNNSGRNENSNYEDGVVTEFDDDRVFELVLKSGLVVRLQAFNKITRDEWISRLDELRIYWQARLEADARALTRLKADNLEQLHIDEEMESHIGEAASKWEALRGIADPQIYNVCPLSFCRSITMKGPLFFKLRKQASFKLNYIVICHGHLLIYEEQSRTTSGVEVPKIYRKKRDVIPLKECYAYSGILTEADLMQHNNSFNVSAAPGMFSMPRIYADGTTASDDEFSRCFVLWRANSAAELAPRDAAAAFGKQFRKKSKAAAGVASEPGDRFYSINRLGVSGTPLMFMARSRMEKEMWVSVITDEIGRVQEKSVSHHVVS